MAGRRVSNSDSIQAVYTETSASRRERIASRLYMSTEDKEYLWRSIESEGSGSECHSQAQEEEIVKTREPDDS